MKQQTLTNREIAALTGPLALMLRSGLRPGDALALLAEDEKDESIRTLLMGLAQDADFGTYLSSAMENSGRFPNYVSALLAVGERTGHTEEALNALSEYYERSERTQQRIKNALTYPIILLVLMLAVIVVLLSQVLPVFDDVYASLGGRLSGIAGGLLLVGRWLDRVMPVLCVLLGVVLAALALISLHSGIRDKVLALWNRHMGDRGVGRKFSDARFAQALSMGLSSGLALEEALELSAALLKDIPAAADRCGKCLNTLAEGKTLALALRETQMLPAASCRLLEVGLRAGSGDTTMANIAVTLSEEAELALEEKVAKIEPTLVLVTSILVGAILLSVMLPLMHIMSAIG